MIFDLDTDTLEFLENVTVDQMIEKFLPDAKCVKINGTLEVFYNGRGYLIYKKFGKWICSELTCMEARMNNLPDPYVDFEIICAADTKEEVCYSLVIYIYSDYNVEKFIAMVERSSITI